MKRITFLPLLLPVLFLVLITVFLTNRPAFSETTLNDNVNVTGNVFLNGENGGVNFADGSHQSTAAAHPWCHILLADKRFELVMNNEAVLDRETGLLWQRNPTIIKYDWAGAMGLCYKISINNSGGWRLPTVVELRTFIDENQNPALPSGHPFINIQKSYYWSSTENAQFSDKAYLVNFTGGFVDYHDKSEANWYVIAVRSGW